MKHPLFRTLSAALIFTAAIATTTPTASAQQTDHVLPSASLQQDLNATAAARQQHEQQIRSLYAQPQLQTALRAAHIDPQQVTHAVSQLSDADLASIAARSAAAQKDFAAGRISDHDLLIILVCIAALLVVIVAVH